MKSSLPDNYIGNEIQDIAQEEIEKADKEIEAAAEEKAEEEAAESEYMEIQRAKRKSDVIIQENPAPATKRQQYHTAIKKTSSAIYQISNINFPIA